MSCKYCNVAFDDATLRDLEHHDLFEELRKGIIGDELFFSVSVNEYGELQLSCDNGNEYVRIGSKKIKYCPMCGANIPDITPTQKSDGELGIDSRMI